MQLESITLLDNYHHVSNFATYESDWIQSFRKKIIPSVWGFATWKCFRENYCEGAMRWKFLLVNSLFCPLLAVISDIPLGKNMNVLLFMPAMYVFTLIWWICGVSEMTNRCKWEIVVSFMTWSNTFTHTKHHAYLLHVDRHSWSDLFFVSANI